jgi:hypothetical protein
VEKGMWEWWEMEAWGSLCIFLQFQQNQPGLLPMGYYDASQLRPSTPCPIHGISYREGCIYMYMPSNAFASRYCI